MRVSSPLMLLCLAAASQPAPARADTPDGGFVGLGYPNRELLDATTLERLPSGDSMHQVLAQAVVSAVFANQEGLGFSELEPSRLTLTGNSAQWTQWRLERLNLTDPLFDGAEGFHLPWAFVSELEVLNAESARNQLGGGVRFGLAPVSSRAPTGASVSFTAGGVGGMVPFALPIDDVFTGIHPTLRQAPPDTDRERLLSRAQLRAWDTATLQGGYTLRTSTEVSTEKRHHLSYGSADGLAQGQPYDEGGTRVSEFVELAPAERQWRAYLLAEYLHRDTLFSEQGFSQQETQALTTEGVMAGVISELFRVGLTWKRYGTSPTTRDFSRELFDADGLGRFPFIPTGVMNTARLELGFALRGFYLEGDLRLLGWHPDGPQTHALTFLGAAAGTMNLTSRDTATWVGEHRAGWAHVFDFRWLEVAVDAFVTLNHANAAGLSVVLPGAGLKADVVAKLSDFFEPFAAVAYTPVGLTSQLALAMTPGYLDARQFTGAGQLVQTFGGGSARVDPTLRTASTASAAIGVRSRFATYWRVSVQGVAKVWDGVPRLALDGSAERYGHFTDGAYFFNGGPTRYLLVNTPSSQLPFGGAVQFQLSRLDDGVGFLHLGFTASTFLGSAPPNNGAWGNDVGMLDWSGATPNGAKNAFSATDGDRGYIVRMGAGRKLWQRLWGSLAVAFRDGQPFAFNGYATENGQVATYMERPRGSPLKASSPLLGWRTDFQLVVDAQLSYEVPLSPSWTLRLKLVGANLLDLDNELIERQSGTAEGYGRSSLTTSTPRSFSFGVELLEGLPR